MPSPDNTTSIPKTVNDAASFTMGQKNVHVFPASQPGCPLVVLNSFTDAASELNSAIRSSISHDITLVEIDGLSWDHDMTPWDAPPLFAGDTPCTGGADEYLDLLLHRILPQVEKLAPAPFAWRGIAGYSLAGLFATYAPFCTDAFSRIASMSGSLWFPDFVDFVQSHTLCDVPDRAFFSLGKQEARTRNRFLRTVRTNTEEIQRSFEERGSETVFRLNPGNHYQDALERTVAGIAWMIEG